jgi:hypothetical protein
VDGSGALVVGSAITPSTVATSIRSASTRARGLREPISTSSTPKAVAWLTRALGRLHFNRIHLPGNAAYRDAMRGIT